MNLMTFAAKMDSYRLGSGLDEGSGRCYVLPKYILYLTFSEPNVLALLPTGRSRLSTLLEGYSIHTVSLVAVHSSLNFTSLLSVEGSVGGGFKIRTFGHFGNF